MAVLSDFEDNFLVFFRSTLEQKLDTYNYFHDFRIFLAV